MKIKAVKGIFRVDGVTMTLIRKLVTKKLADYTVNKKQPTQEQYYEKFSELVDQMWEEIKPKKLSNELDTPQAALDFVELLEKTTPESDYRDIQIMINKPKKNKLGEIEVNPKTGKPKMHWLPYSKIQDEVQQEAAA